nr:MAG TPA: hypothetical protein [Caudoviricetes sp.]
MQTAPRGLAGSVDIIIRIGPPIVNKFNNEMLRLQRKN